MKIKSLLLFSLFSTTLFAQITVVEDSVFSPSVQSTMKFMAVLPDGYAKNHERFPILYLLHGFAGDHTNWVKLTNLVRYAKEYRIIIVTPDAKNSWYTNSATAENAKYEDYIMTDLMSAVEKKYRIIQSKFNRGIGGLSMGGYGAVKFGLKYPQKFFFVAGISPSMQWPSGLEDSAMVARRSKESNQSVREAFGAARSEQWNENDVFFLTEKANGKSLPYFYLSTGSQDGIPEIITQTHSLADLFRRKGVTFEMHETAGGHDWKFWDKEIEIVLQRMADIIGKKK